jgi:hypothetical protein
MRKLLGLVLIILVGLLVWFFYFPRYNVAAFPRVVPGKVVDFAAGKNSGALISGWGDPEQSWVWSTGKEAQLGLLIQGTLGSSARMSFECIAFVSPKVPEQKLEIWSGRTKLADVILPGPQDWFTVPLARLHWSGDGPLVLHFKMPLAVSPKALGMWADDRLLTFGLKTLRIDP